MRNRKANQGFTLIELLIVIAIIGILAAVLIPNLLSARNRANDSATQSFVRQVVTGVEAQRDPVTQALPDTGTACIALTGNTALPNAVTACTYTNNGDDTYEVSATSTTTQAFTYNGTEIVAE